MHITSHYQSYKASTRDTHTISFALKNVTEANLLSNLKFCFSASSTHIAVCDTKVSVITVSQI